MGVTVEDSWPPKSSKRQMNRETKGLHGAWRLEGIKPPPPRATALQLIVGVCVIVVTTGVNLIGFKSNCLVHDAAGFPTPKPSRRPSRDRDPSSVRHPRSRLSAFAYPRCGLLAAREGKTRSPRDRCEIASGLFGWSIFVIESPTASGTSADENSSLLGRPFFGYLLNKQDQKGSHY